ncbi:hypothetical protein [uncultured Mediterranean phage uvMED]|nr:hypothetical protein [uncultured Mediterranean phage uvMED]
MNISSFINSVESLVSTNFSNSKELKYKRNPAQNGNLIKNYDFGYGVIGDQLSQIEDRLGAVTVEQAFNLILLSYYKSGKDEEKANEKIDDLCENAFTIYKKMQETTFTDVIKIDGFSISRPIVDTGSKLVIIVASFNARYRKNLN